MAVRFLEFLDLVGQLQLLFLRVSNPQTQSKLNWLMFALYVCLNTLSSRKYKSFAVPQEFGHSGD